MAFLVLGIVHAILITLAVALSFRLLTARVVLSAAMALTYVAFPHDTELLFFHAYRYRKAGSSSRVLRSSVRRVASPASPTASTATVTLHKESSEGFGLKFGGARNPAEAEESGAGIFVSGTAPDSVADRCDDLRVGWQIVSLNGAPLLDATFAEMKEALQSVGNTMVRAYGSPVHVVLGANRKIAHGPMSIVHRSRAPYTCAWLCR